jgi:hypothetical protein
MDPREPTTTVGMTTVGVSAEGRRVAAVDVYPDPDSEQATLRFRVDAGHLPATVRRELVEAVLNLSQLRDCYRLHIALPLGDAELLRDLEQHCAALNAHAAGATCLIEADIDPLEGDRP